jgi:NhaP-type Na+/H+ or K+/H+ antiporter
LVGRAEQVRAVLEGIGVGLRDLDAEGFAPIATGMTLHVVDGRFAHLLRRVKAVYSLSSGEHTALQRSLRMLSPALQLAMVVAIGIGAQWLAWRVAIPSILFLLVAGWLTGPVLGWIQPDALVGDLLMPMVSLSVGLILFEGGMSLHYREIAIMGRTTWHLVTIGAAATWLLITLSAHFILALSWPVALLTGAILVVTGPTVIGPMLRHVRPSPQVASVLKWEGIVIDPIGAMLAVLVLEAALDSGHANAAAIALSLAKIIVAGALAGFVGAHALLFCLRRFWVPDYLQNPVVLATVLMVFAGSNAIQAESGLIAVTLMGIVITNQDKVVVKQVIAFKENLRVLLLSVLFILLSARLDPTFLKHLDWRIGAFIAVLVLVVRPVAVWLSTIGSGMPRAERALLSWVAPRGIVAAAITSVFAFEMEQAGYEDAGRMVPIVFFVIASTVALYGLTARPFARWLNITQPDPSGILIAGAHAFARDLAKCLKDSGIKVRLLDRNAVNVRTARLEGLDADLGDILDEERLDDTIPRGIGKLLALTPNDKVNSLAALHFAEVLEQKNIFQLAQPKASRLTAAELPRHFMGRVLFKDDLTYDAIQQWLQKGYNVKQTPLTQQFNYEAYMDRYAGNAIPLMSVRSESVVKVYCASDAPKPEPGAKLIALVPPPTMMT